MYTQLLCVLHCGTNLRYAADLCQASSSSACPSRFTCTSLSQKAVGIANPHQKMHLNRKQKLHAVHILLRARPSPRGHEQGLLPLRCCRASVPSVNTDMASLLTGTEPRHPRCGLCACACNVTSTRRAAVRATRTALPSQQQSTQGSHRTRALKAGQYTQSQNTAVHHPVTTQSATARGPSP